MENIKYNRPQSWEFTERDFFDVSNYLKNSKNIRNKMNWNHRVLAFEHKGSAYFQIHEVYYDENGVPNSYTENAVGIYAEEFDELEWTLDRMKECLKKDVLWGDERFPQIYEKI